RGGGQRILSQWENRRRQLPWSRQTLTTSTAASWNAEADEKSPSSETTKREDDDCDSGCGDFDNNLRLPDYRVSCAESLMSTTSANESCFDPQRSLGRGAAENLKNACRQFPQSLWDIECRPGGRPFESSEQRVAIPGTARVILCSACNGRGWQVCVACHGSGRADCDTCFGGDFAAGRQPPTGVSVAGGVRPARVSRMQRDREYGCPYCTGVGHLHCKACLGKGKLQRYMQLTVRFDSISSNQLMCERMDLLESRLSKVTGVLLHETDSAAEGLPLTQFSKEVRQLSQAMLDYHAEQAKRTEARILRQRQVLHAVPVTQVDYTWRGRNGTLWIYGNEQKCFCPIWRAPAAPCCK
uniref:B box-type domain-containing protein n=1 Tax=Macrostomum lignano TaxID=282301 RepID=A0A1I8F9C2_9PLAT